MYSVSVQYIPMKLEIKDTTEYPPSVLYLDILLKLNANFKLTT
jgi:hypothetical protein